MTKKVPTIKHLLNSMPSVGMVDTKSTLETYANLSYYYDGKDMKFEKVAKIRKKMAEMDALLPTPKFEVVEHDDWFELKIEGIDPIRFESPTLKNMPEMKSDNVPSSFIDAITKLTDSKLVFDLPYHYFNGVVDVVGKSIGIS